MNKILLSAYSSFTSLAIGKESQSLI